MTQEPKRQIDNDLHKWMKSSDDYHYMKMVSHNWISPKSKKTPHGINTKDNVALLKEYFQTPLRARKITNLATIRTYTPWNLIRLTWKRPLPPLTTKSATKQKWVIRGRFKTHVSSPKYKIKTLHRPLIMNIN